MTTNTGTQLSLLKDFKPRPKLRLSQVEDYINQTRAIVPCPTRNTLIAWAEQGVVEGKQIGTLGWVFFEDSLVRFLAELDQEAIAA